MTYYNNDTICALATATGGALSIIRISGPDSLRIICSVCKSITEATPPNTVTYTDIRDDEGNPIDDVMVSVFHSPHSYTGENSAEISCHGSRYIASKIVSLLISHGCRQALPGEYTQRAYLNGKLALDQAEAVADLIASTNAATHKLALSQLRGNISSELADLREKLLKLTSLLELELDFSDHEDLELADRSELLSLAKDIDDKITTLDRSFEAGKAIKEGVPVAIIGKTNVGKSTLLNRLLNDDKAIVSNIHGTTRDVIEDNTLINGVSFRFIDTAGIRDTSDEIERLGIERTYKKIQEATVILWLIDEQPSKEELEEMASLTLNKSLIIVQNKIDILPELDTDESLPFQTIHISAKKGVGISQLENAIYKAANIPEITENDTIITSARHYDALLRAHETFTRVIEAVNNNYSSDLIAEDLRIVLSQLAEITGKGIITPQETLNNIFSHFCVGK